MPSAQTIDQAVAHLRHCVELVEGSDGYVDRLWVHADTLAELFRRADNQPAPEVVVTDASRSVLADLRGQVRDAEARAVHAEARAVKAEQDAKAARKALARERAA